MFAQAADPEVVEQVRTDIAGVSIHALRGGSGPKVVYLHHSFGSPGWLPFHEELASGCTVYAPDLPGFGQSTQPRWARHPRDLAILLSHWLRQLKIGPACFVGCGFGGWIAVEMATMAPEFIRSLVLVGAAGLLPENGRIRDQILTSHSQYVRAAFSSQEAYERVYGAELTDELLVQWDVNREMTTRVAWKPYMYNRRLISLLPLMAAPTLLVWGGEDGVVPLDCAQQYLRLLPQARLEVVAGCGHAVDLEQPERLARLVSSQMGA